MSPLLNRLILPLKVAQQRAISFALDRYFPRLKRRIVAFRHARHAANPTVPMADPECFEVRWIIAEILAETRLGKELRAKLETDR
jgi:hypothetical protein